MIASDIRECMNSETMCQVDPVLPSLVNFEFIID